MKIMMSLVFVFFAISTWAADSLNLGLVGDAGVTNPIINKMRLSLKAHGVNQIILLGDNLYNNKQTYEEVWDPWKDENFDFFAVAIGNHNKTIESEMAYFGLAEDHYSFFKSGARFIVLDSENSSNISQQIQFADTVLTQSRSTQIYIILHHPYVSASRTHYWQERSAFQKKFRSLVAKHHQKITAVLSGHDHLASFLDVDGVPLVISGASHESRLPEQSVPKDSVFNVTKKWEYKGGKYWTQLAIADQGLTAWIRYVPFDGASETCEIRIYPKPYQLGPDCLKKNLKKSL